MPPRDCNGHCYPRNKKREQNKKDKTMRIKLCGLVACAAMLVAGLVSCQQEEIPQSLQYPILFGYSDTRAVADLDDLKDNGFKVYAYFKGNTGNSATFEKEVTYDEDANVWGYEGLEYWIPGVEYWFKAFYPVSLEGVGSYGVTNTNSSQNLTISEFNITKQVDIMVASATAKVPEGASYPAGDNGSVVPLKFQHLLACVDIKIKSAISGITINKVTIGNADNLGEYSNDEWTSTSSDDIEVDSNKALTVGDDFVSVVGDGVLVIPASPAGKYLAVEASNGKTYEVDFPSTVDWEKGKKYSYTLEIKQSNIVFSEPKVDEWDSENATGSVIIK